MKTRTKKKRRRYLE